VQTTGTYHTTVYPKSFTPQSTMALKLENETLKSQKGHELDSARVSIMQAAHPIPHTCKIMGSLFM
jgi:hypothetical protein